MEPLPDSISHLSMSNDLYSYVFYRQSVLQSVVEYYKGHQFLSSDGFLLAMTLSHLHKYFITLYLVPQKITLLISQADVINCCHVCSRYYEIHVIHRNVCDTLVYIYY